MSLRTRFALVLSLPVLSLVDASLSSSALAAAAVTRNVSALALAGVAASGRGTAVALGSTAYNTAPTSVPRTRARASTEYPRRRGHRE